MLAERGIQCRVLSMATVKPLDVESLVRAVDETGRIVTVEEHTVEGGLGGAVAEILLELGCIPTCFHRIGLRAGFSSIVGTQKYLRKVYGMDAPAIVAVVEKKLLSKEQRLSEYVAR
jgi:transketolase